jgi:hypothetical protein
MSDRFWARLEFPAALIDAEITEALEAEGVNMAKLDPSESADDYAWIEDGIFTLEDSEARYGQFEDLEGVLKLKGIPFDRESAGYYEFIPERVIFRPATNGDLPREMVFLLCDGDPVVSVAAIREALDRTDTEEGPEENVRDYLNFNFPAYPPLTDWVQEKTP